VLRRSGAPARSPTRRSRDRRTGTQDSQPRRHARPSASTSTSTRSRSAATAPSGASACCQSSRRMPAAARPARLVYAPTHAWCLHLRAQGGRAPRRHALGARADGGRPAACRPRCEDAPAVREPAGRRGHGAPPVAAVL
jgi:hypothetical protein